MKVFAIVLACVVGMAWGQGRAITNQFGANQFNQFSTGFNTITNTRARTCGTFQDVCYGQGLETVGAMPVNPFIAQCQAGVAKRYGFLLRVNRDGTTVITDRFGQLAEDMEIAEVAAGPGVNFAAQSAARQQAFNVERMTLELEFCGGAQ